MAPEVRKCARCRIRVGSSRQEQLASALADEDVGGHLGNLSNHDTGNETAEGHADEASRAADQIRGVTRKNAPAATIQVARGPAIWYWSLVRCSPCSAASILS